MARPKINSSEDLATTKIENAFWKILEFEDYSKVTVKEISKMSGTNRNSFYYHYKDINDLASTAFKNNAKHVVNQIFTEAMLISENKEYIPNNKILFDTLQQSKRLMLCARSNSVFLKLMVQDLLQDIWFEIFGIDKEILTPVEKLQVSFIFSGITSVLGSSILNEKPTYMIELVQSDIWKSAFSTIKEIAKSQKL